MRYPARIKIAVPVAGRGHQRTTMPNWLDETCRAEGLAMASAGIIGIANDAVAFYFPGFEFRRRLCADLPTSGAGGSRYSVKGIAG